MIWNFSLFYRISEEYDLSNISFGSGTQRHLVLFRDHSVYEFLEKLQDLAQKNEIVNYEIIPPSASTGHSFPMQS